jgi:hypothetical protein
MGLKQDTVDIQGPTASQCAIHIISTADTVYAVHEYDDVDLIYSYVSETLKHCEYLTELLQTPINPSPPLPGNGGMLPVITP